MSKKILITGGAGYIGSHTICDMIESGYQVICLDNLSRSSTDLIKGIEEITGQALEFYQIDLKNKEQVFEFFEQHNDIDGIIHFAAYKAVGESVEEPLLYYENNLNGLIYLLMASEQAGIKNFVFSSSCSVYGNADELPVSELTPRKEAESPYGRSKQMGEDIIMDLAKVSPHNFILLRYFNPVGAHPSALIGEIPIGKPSNLVPVITQTAAGHIKQMQVYGDDYNTRDGSCIRDYIHVCDIARAHTLAISYLIDQHNESNLEIFNLGTGNGISVLQALQSFEKVTGIKPNYNIGPRREGDVVAVYADNTKAKEILNWQIVNDIDGMMSSAWKWQLKLDEKN